MDIEAIINDIECGLLDYRGCLPVEYANPIIKELGGKKEIVPGDSINTALLYMFALITKNLSEKQ